MTDVTVQILDVCFDIENAGREFAGTLGEFGYIRELSDCKISKIVEVKLADDFESYTQTLRVMPTEIQFHRSPYEQWQLKAHMAQTSKCRDFILPAEGLVFSLSGAGTSVVIHVDPKRNSARCTEVIHLFFRNIAIYARSSAMGAMLHATATVYSDGARVMIGPSGGGKTEALLSDVFRSNARPLSNDRTCVNFADGIAYGFPSYLTAFPETFLRFPELAHVSRASVDQIEDASAPARKFFISMGRIAVAAGRPYEPSARIKTLCFFDGRWSSTRKPLSLDLDSDEHIHRAVSVLEKCCFDGGEPSYTNWHGFKLPVTRHNWKKLLLDTKARKIDLVLLTSHGFCR
jgi:hypothetical protein